LRRKDPKQMGKIKSIAIKPFLRWAGGKTWLLKRVNQFIPEKIHNYYEPFLGGGAIFFCLKQLGKLKNKSILADTNKDLIDCFLQVRDNVEQVIEHLKNYKNEKYFYYLMRDLTPNSDSEKAAKFIYLNRTSFNGIYRVNLNGKYNVPYGFKTYNTLFDFDNLRGASDCLANAEIVHNDFQPCLDDIGKDDLAFLDPPYTVAHGNNGFIKYNQKIFAWEDQIRLADTITTINKKGAYYVLTNASHPTIEDLFGALGTKVEFNRYSVIGGRKAKRELTNEYVFTNVRQNGGTGWKLMDY
jgi:DNA adenine methylase